MKLERNFPAADLGFTNAAVMNDQQECLGRRSDTTIPHSGGSKQIQNRLTEPDENDVAAISSVESERDAISSVQTERWKKLSHQIRGAIAVKNAVKQNRRKSSRKSTANIDPFLQRFSTREIGLTKQTSRASLYSLPEEKLECFDEDEITSEEDDENNHSKLTYFLGLTCDACHPTEVIDPDGSFLYYWVYILITAIRYNFWVIILRVAFLEAQENYAALWWVLDSVSDLVYLLDIFINCRVGFVNEGILVKHPKQACKLYLKSLKFFLDALSLLPLEFLYFQIGVQPILRFPRLLKVYKSQEIRSRLEGRANHASIVRVFFLVHLMFLLIHWNAGIYFLISRAEGFGSNEWLYPLLNGSYDTLTRKYVRSFYWSALTLTTIGDLPSPVTNVEYIYTIACYLSGVFVFAIIVGNAGSIILSSNAGRLEFEKQRDNAKNYMKIHDVPRDLQRRVLKWYDYSWSRGRMGGAGGDLNSLHALPDKMKTEIALHVHLETLKKVTFLQNCEPEFLHVLLLKMKLHIFTPGDLIIRCGEIAREMYLIAHGRIEVISEAGILLKELGLGDFFGEIGILSLSEGQNRRTADVRSIGYTECFVLSKDDVLGEIHEFPHAQKILAEYGRKRLQNTSGDPRLVKLDTNNVSASHKTTSQERKKSHVVDIVPENRKKDFERSAKNKNRLKEDGTDGSSKVHDPVKVTLFQTVASSLVEQERKDQRVGHVMSKDGTNEEKRSRDDTRDFDKCFDTLDNMKIDLQKTIENKMKKYKEHISQLENQLAIEKERSYQSELRIKRQAKEIYELSSLNKAMGQHHITESDSEISEEVEYKELRKSSNDDRENVSDIEDNAAETAERETVLFKQDSKDMSTGLSPTEKKIAFCDTAC